MSGFAARLSSLLVVRLAREKTQLLFSPKYLLLTNTAISVGLSGAGDVMQQRYEILRDYKKGYEPVRTAHIGATGLALGPIFHYWYIWLDRIMPGKSLRVVTKKIIVDTIFMTPVNVGVFLAMVGWMEGMNNREMILDLKQKGTPLCVAECVAWPPAEYISFRFLPTRFRVLFDNAVSLAFDNYYCYIKYRGPGTKMAQAVATNDAEKTEKAQEEKRETALVASVRIEDGEVLISDTRLVDSEALTTNGGLASDDINDELEVPLELRHFVVGDDIL